MDNELIKYPRTYHLPFSQTKGGDDKDFKHLDYLSNKEIIVTLKMDGQNCSMTKNYIFQRSINSRNENARLTGSLVKSFYNSMNYLIPEDWRICGEDMTYIHSIEYSESIAPYLVFNIWNENNECLSFSETLDWCELLGFSHVPILYEGKFDLEKLENIFNNLNFEKQEGIVVRNKEKFEYQDFSKNVCKAVRPNHVQTDEFWAKRLKFNNIK